MAPRTAGIIVIGNEILSGKVRDTNSDYLARELRALGVSVRRIVVIPDEVDVIGREVAAFSADFDLVFTSGGVGPTHDDVTMEGVAAAFGLRTVEHPKLTRIVRHWCGGRDERAAMKMARVPEGSEIVDGEGMKFPPILCRNVYIFPGIPDYLVTKFEAIKERFRCEPFVLVKVYVNEEECFIAEHLDRMEADFESVAIGSYPKIDQPDYKVIVTMESTDAALILRATETLLDLLPKGSVIRVEK